MIKKNKKLVYSFKNAINGLVFCFKTQLNFRIHTVTATMVVITAAYFKLSRWQWAAVVICISMVLVAELINTAIEKICDYVNPSYHPQIKIIKDMAATAVLLTAVMSIIIGLFIFIPVVLHIKNYK